MDLNLLRFFFDLGLFILILLVQLVIYPGFRFYDKNDLISWHSKYTKRISLVVVPLMFGQLIIAVIFLLRRSAPYDIAVSFMVLAVWLITFLYFVPAHRKISNGEHNKALLRQMVQINWWRTAIWSAIFVWTFLEIIVV